jgi:uncharacterized delta-60 repeat protein
MRRLLVLSLLATGCPDEGPLTPGSVPFSLRAENRAERFDHVQGLKKVSADATLRVTLRSVTIAVADDNGPPDVAGCAWARRFAPWCFDAAGGFLTVDVQLRTAAGTIVHRSGEVRLVGADPDVFMTRGSAFWDEEAFVTDGGEMTLHAPLDITVDLAEIPVGEPVTVSVTAEASVVGRLTGESSSTVSLEGEVVTAGLASAGVLDEVATSVPVPPPCGTSPGTLAFDSGTYFAVEGAGRAEPVVVRRLGGTDGEVSVTVRTTSGTAIAGEDFVAADTVVSFADGDDVPRLVPVTILLDEVSESDETFSVALADPACATVGEPAGAEVTLMGVDPPVPDYSLGGEISGLAGGSVVLRHLGLDQTFSSNGVFALRFRYREGDPYDVTIVGSPPTQLCTLSHGTGTFGAADVTTVRVTCEDGQSTPGLDPDFGIGGQALGGPLYGDAMAVAPDGKIVVVRNLAVARYLTDGSPDLGFGVQGKVSLLWTSSSEDKLFDVVVQPDRKILVVGSTAADFAIARLLENGDLDPDFGTEGRTLTDFAGEYDRATAVLLQPDGKIVVGGSAGDTDGANLLNDFGVVRYSAAGVLEEGFGTGGRTSVDIAGRTDLVAAVALQPDGKILLGGRVAIDGGADPDFGVVRVLTGGSVDEDFGASGIVRLPLTDDSWDELVDLAVQPDGKILLAGAVRVGGSLQFALARLLPTGAQDEPFGLKVPSFSGEGDHLSAMAVQPDGKIVLVGQSANASANSNLAMARFLADGSVDTSFDGDGKREIDFFGKRDSAVDAAIDPSGKLVVAGFATNATTVVNALVRLIP